MSDLGKVIKAYEDFVNGYECFCTSDDYEYEMHKAVLALLKDRTKDYEAWAKEIGADTCVNCRHASWNRNDGTSTCPIEHNFALVKDGFCHLFMRMEGR